MWEWTILRCANAYYNLLQWWTLSARARLQRIFYTRELARHACEGAIARARCACTRALARIASLDGSGLAEGHVFSLLRAQRDISNRRYSWAHMSAKRLHTIAGSEHDESVNVRSSDLRCNALFPPHRREEDHFTISRKSLVAWSRNTIPRKADSLHRIRIYEEFDIYLFSRILT